MAISDMVQNDIGQGKIMFVLLRTPLLHGYDAPARARQDLLVEYNVKQEAAG
jgi:hypothetical protein